jgi:hypothetical protein
MSHDPGALHISDEALLAHLDGEPEVTENPEVREHLGRCADCRERLEAIGALSAEFDGEMRGLDLSAPEALLPSSLAEVQRRARAHPRAERPILRQAAAVLLVLGAGALVATPLAARVLVWVGRQLRDGAPTATAPQRPAPRPAAPPADPEAADRSEFRFVPEGAELRLTFASAQEQGTLRVGTTEETSASFRVLGADAARSAVLVLPSEIRVRNGGIARASYQLSVPGTVTLVTVVVGARAPIEIRPASLRESEQRPVPLGAAAAQ